MNRKQRRHMGDGYHRQNEGYPTAASVKSFRKIEQHLCNGFNSHCDTCDCLTACAFGKRWVFDFKMQKINRPNAEVEKLEKLKALKKRRVEQGLCRDCGAKLPDGYEKRTCERCLERNRAAYKRKAALAK